MKLLNVWAASIVALAALFLNFELAFAHETVTVGNYELEIGWLNEPPVAGQQNAIVINVSDISNGEAKPVEDVRSLIVSISYGGHNKILILQPLDEDTPGQFAAPILPTIPGLYTMILGGKIGNTSINNIEVEPEEVAPADILQFPSADTAVQDANPSLNNWLIYTSTLIALIALGVAITALRYSKK